MALNEKFSNKELMLLTYVAYVASTVSVRTLTKNLKKLIASLLNILIKFNLLG